MSDPSRPAADPPRPDAAGSHSAFEHRPVMVAEIVADLGAVPDGVVLDATVGGAGHAVAIADAHPGLRVVGLDRDPDAVTVAGDRLGERGTVVRARFDELDRVLDELEVAELSGFLFDLGVSSPQLDRADRGFSFRNDGPLDMRMDPEHGVSAADLIDTISEAELAAVLRRNADERFAGRIARAIVAARPLERTAELAEVVVAAIPAAARRTGGHPAKRTFQAIRIEVNGELTILRPALEAAIDRLAPGGRGLVLTYHSGEDRIVKSVIRDRTTIDTPPGLPVARPEPEFVAMRPLGRRPSDHEQSSNTRAASARLRGIERRPVARSGERAA